MKNSRVFRIPVAPLIASVVTGCGGGNAGSGGFLAPTHASNAIVAPQSLQPQSQTKIGGTWKHPYGVAVDQSTHDVYVSDDTSVKKIEPDGTTTPVGTGLLGPHGIAVDSTTHDVYVSDSHDVKVIHPNGKTDTVGSGFVSPYVAEWKKTNKIWKFVP